MFIKKKMNLRSMHVIVSMLLPHTGPETKKNLWVKASRSNYWVPKFLWKSYWYWSMIEKPDNLYKS